MANPWFRLWTDMVNDPKFRTIARVSKQEVSRVLSVYLYMMTCASNANERGRTEGWCDEDVATALSIETSDVEAIREAMQGRVLDGDYLSGWEKRQPKREREDDNSTERSRQSRQRQKEQPETTQRHATPCNANDSQETPREEEIREEKKREEKQKTTAQPSVALPDWMPMASWTGYIEMRKKKRKDPTARAVELLIGELERLRDEGQDIAAVLDKSTVNGWTDVYPLKIEPQVRGSPANKQLDLAAAQKAANEEAKRRLFGKDDGRTIDA